MMTFVFPKGGFLLASLSQVLSFSEEKKESLVFEMSFGNKVALEREVLENYRFLSAMDKE
jgi:hypothetical protein